MLDQQILRNEIGQVAKALAKRLRDSSQWEIIV